ncbi:MAG: ABC transporter ATP-binding protein [Candidatus Omnitrophica bacterium]|nr:ABC transporter ATP-binding protein [Candidatus Omnitrophota bacterium]
MLEIEALTCGYDKKAVVSSVSVEVKSGEFFGVIGPNGSGKTTLLRALSRVIQPMSGKIFLDKKEFGSISLQDFSRGVAVVSQLFPLAQLTVEEFVLLGRIPYFGRMQFIESRHDREVAYQCMELTDVLRLKDKPIQHLSGGERQLVQIARAFTQEPKLVLLDEPTAHLDITHQVAIMDLLKKLVRELNLTVVMVLHDLNLASEYCDRLTLISQGTVYKTGTPWEVIDYRVIEKVYQTVVVVNQNPISAKPHVLIVPGEELIKNKRG